MAELIPAWVDGRLTAVEKIAVHRQGLRHMAVSVFVLSGGETLIQRRALTKYHTPGLWANSCCTHPHWGETPLDCARRRLAQELGVRGLDLSRIGQVEYRADVGDGMTEHEVVEIFTATAPSRPDVVPDPAEVMDTRWVTPDGLAAQIEAEPGLFTPWLRIYMRDHAGQIFGPA